MPKYTIAMVNYNMADTLAESLKSVLDQVDERFEVFVVDGGSTDGSVEILETLSAEYAQLRFKVLTPVEDRYLGEERNISVREAKGEYILTQIDTDDHYHDGLQDFVKMYHQFEDQLDFDFYMIGSHIGMGKRDFLLEHGPFRNVAAAEELDLWRRLLAEDRLLVVRTKPIWEQIGYEKDLRGRFRRDIDVKISEFQTGITLKSCLRRSLQLSRLSQAVYDIPTYLFTYFVSRTRPQYELPSKFREKGALESVYSEEQATVRELEQRYDIEIDRDVFDDRGHELFFSI